jgi:hypothetical protein
MKQSQEEVNANTYVPWLDSALLPEESEYSVVNKAAWFLSMPPSVFLRVCKLPQKLTRLDPHTLSLFESKKIIELCRTNEHLTPVIYGIPMYQYLASVLRDNKHELIRDWYAKSLRVCPKCIAMGVHLSIHQHLAIDKCPVHLVFLQSTCSRCGMPLSKKEQGKQLAFCCEHCRAPLLNNDLIELYHTDEFRHSVKACIQQFKEWKLRALIDQQVDCGVGRVMPYYDDFSPWCRQAIQLSAAVPSVQTPSWVRHVCIDGVDIEYKTLNLNTNWGLALQRGISGNIPDSIEKLPYFASAEKSTNNALESAQHKICRGRFRLALRRVTSIFLSRHGSKHPDCLNTPREMFGKNITWNHGPEDILLCCPIAVGFWMWRNSSVDTYYWILNERMNFEFTRAREANIDLLLYAIARSHLHYCISLVKQCIDKAMESESFQLDQAISPIDVGMIGNTWSPLYFERLQFYNQYIDISGRAYYIHFDVSAVLDDIPCKGRKALDNRAFKCYEPLWRNPIRSLSKMSNCLLEPKYAESDKPAQPFTPTLNEFMFVPDTNETEDDARIAEARWMLRSSPRSSRESKLDSHAVLNTSINSKHDC